MRALSMVALCLLLVASSVLTLVPTAVAEKDPRELKRHAPITIMDDSDFLDAVEVSGVVGGSGSADDPYTIEGWSIDASDSEGVQVGPAMISAGILVVETGSHFVIRNVWIRGDDDTTGIALESVQHASVLENRVTRCQTGIVVGDSPPNGAAFGEGVVLRGNLVSDCFWGIAVGTRSGISRLYPGIGAVISNNVVRSTGIGIYLYTKGILLSHNLVVNVWRPEGAIYGFLSESVLTGNVVINSRIGIHLLSDSERNMISGNTVRDTERGISLVEVFNSTIAGNTILDSRGETGTAIELHISVDNNVTGNIIRGSDVYGIMTWSSPRSRIENNQLSDTTRGIWVQRSRPATVIGNTIRDSRFAIAFCGSPEQLTIENNEFLDVDYSVTQILTICRRPYPPPEP